jgi:hypothetical protein
MIETKTTTEVINNQAGLLLAGEIGKKIGLPGICSDISANCGDTITHIFGAQVQGHSTYASIDKFCSGEYFKTAMNTKRQLTADDVRINLLRLSGKSEKVVEELEKANTRLLHKVKPSPIIVNKSSYRIIDGDTSPMDNSGSKKEGVSYTYKGYDGFQPMFFYVGTEGYMLSSELRPGSQHCQKGTPELIIKANKKLEELWPGKKFLYRLDSGNDSKDTVKAILHNGEGKTETGHYLLIKRNKRQENDENWLNYAKRYGSPEAPRPGKTIWRGIAFTHPEGKEFPDKELHIVFEITERSITCKGQMLAIPEIEVETWWTNLNELAETVIELYHTHGTMEQYHSELKDDMDIERMPSGKLAVNKIVFASAMLAYNTLRIIGQTAINSRKYPVTEEAPSRKRLGKVITDLINIAGKFIKHARKLVYKIACYDPWQPVFMYLAAVFSGW